MLSRCVCLLGAGFAAYALSATAFAEPVDPSAGAQKVKPIRLAQSMYDELYGPNSGYSAKRKWKQNGGRSPYDDDIRPGWDGRGGWGFGSSYRPGTYRTMCVRMCDGYYFPINFSAPGGEVQNDANACQSSCSMPAKLFIYRNPGQDVNEMVDLNGVPYSRIANAFRYRKELVPNCRCKPEPWSEAAKQTHEAYAKGEIPNSTPRVAASDGYADSGSYRTRPKNTWRRDRPTYSRQYYDNGYGYYDDSMRRRRRNRYRDY